MLMPESFQQIQQLVPLLSANLLEKSYNLVLFREHFHQYFEMLLHAKLLNLKTFKDFSFMQNQRLLKTFGGDSFF